MKKIIREIIKIDGNSIEAITAKLGKANMIFAVADKGYVMCGYLNMDIAEKLEDTACVVTGVKTVQELLDKPVVKVTKKAKELGIAVGISGGDALRKMF